MNPSRCSHPLTVPHPMPPGGYVIRKGRTVYVAPYPRMGMHGEFEVVRCIICGLPLETKVSPPGTEPGTQHNQGGNLRDGSTGQGVPAGRGK